LTRMRRGIARARSARGPLSASFVGAGGSASMRSFVGRFCLGSLTSSQADVEPGTRPRPADPGDLHRSHDTVDGVVETAGLLSVDLHPPRLAARAIHDDVDVRGPTAVLRETPAELAAVARVDGVYLVHAERLGLVAVVAEIEREVLAVIVSAASAATAAAAR